MVSSRLMEISKAVLRWPEGGTGRGLAAIEYLLAVSVLACLAWVSVAALSAGVRDFLDTHREARTAEAARNPGGPVTRALVASRVPRQDALTLASQVKSR